MSRSATGARGGRIRPFAALWVLAFSFYALTGSGHSSSWDAILMFLSARNFSYKGDLSVPGYPGTEGMHKTGVDGRQYIKYAPGFVFAHLPMLAVSRVAQHLPLVYLPSGERPRGRYEDEFWVQLTNPWITASVLVLLTLFVTDLGGSRRDAWLVVLLVGLASPVWLYTKADSTEMLQALGLLGACYFLRRARLRAEVSLHPWIAGAFCGLAVLTKTFNAALVPLFVAYLVATARSRRLAATAAFLTPVAAALALTGLHNHVRFGSLFDSGYDLTVERFNAPLVPSLAKLLFSPSYGLLFFWPPCLLAFLGLRRQWRAHPADTALAVGLFLALLVLYARWWAFSGFGWGPRFLIPAVPLVALAAMPVVASGRRAARILTLACLASGCLVQALGATTDHWQQTLFGVYRHVDCGHDGSRCMDDARVTPPRVAWWRLRGAFLRARHPERFAAYAEAPPWRESHPWRWPESAVERQWENTGLDFWAAPPRWRLERYYLWAPGMEAPIPSSPILKWTLAALLAASLVIVLQAVREPARE